MPTPAKLVAAILFAAVAWLTADIIVRTVLEEGVRVGRFRELLAFGGLIVGWRTIGTEATGPTGRGTTVTRTITAGIAAAAILLVLSILLHSFGVMISNSLEGKYTAIGRAASAWMDFVWQDLLVIADPLVLGALFGGAAITGLVAGIAGRVTR